MRRKMRKTIFFAGCEKELGKKKVLVYRKKYGKEFYKLGFKVNDPTFGKNIESIPEKKLFKEDDNLQDKSDLTVAYLPQTKNMSNGTLRELKRAKRKKQLALGFTDDNNLQPRYSSYLDAFYKNFSELAQSLIAYLKTNGNVFINRSKIHRYGVFAARDLKRGKIVISWDIIKRLTKRQLDKLPINEKKYVSKIENDIYVLIGEPARYVNHSCNANTYMGKLQDVAARNIRKGEEITANYSNEKYPVKFKCTCSSKNCKKFIP